MEEEQTIELTRFYVGFGYKSGGTFRKGERQSREWGMPQVCGCCGAPSAWSLEKHVKYDAGNMKYTMDVHVPYCDTCCNHAQARLREKNKAQKLAVASAVLFGIAAAAALWGSAKFEWKFFDNLKFWHFLIVVSGGLGVGHLVNWYLQRSYKVREEELPRTEACTTDLGLELVSTKGRMWSEDDIALTVTTGNGTFADAFREINQGSVDKELKVEGHIVRTQRGDLMVMKAVEPEE